MTTKVNYSDASSIINQARQTQQSAPSSTSNALLAQNIQQTNADYFQVKSSPTATNAAHYAQDLFGLAQSQGAGASDEASLNAAAAAALKGAGVSDSDISTALNAADSQLTAAAGSTATASSTSANVFFTAGGE